jgi:hypothetical protein
MHHLIQGIILIAIGAGRRGNDLLGYGFSLLTYCYVNEVASHECS